MAVMPGHFGELDRRIGEVAASEGLSDIGARVLELGAVPMVRNVAYRWWRGRHLEQAPPDWSVSSFDWEDFIAPPMAGGVWESLSPQAAWSEADADRTMIVQVPLVGRQASLGVMTAQLAVERGAWILRRIDWTSRLLLLGVTIHEKVETYLAAPSLFRLAPREIECLGLAARGLKAKQIAIRLGIGQQTVQFHLARARIKLSATNTVEAVARSVELGLVRVAP